MVPYDQPEAALVSRIVVACRVASRPRILGAGGIVERATRRLDLGCVILTPPDCPLCSQDLFTRWINNTPLA